jgi:hypothetical protein
VSGSAFDDLSDLKSLAGIELHVLVAMLMYTQDGVFGLFDVIMISLNNRNQNIYAYTP